MAVFKHHEVLFTIFGEDHVEEANRRLPNSMNEDRIDKVPEFTHDIDELTLSRLDPGEQYLAKELSKMRKELRWASETARQGYNKGVDNEKVVSKWRILFESPAKILFWILGIGVVALISGIIARWMK